MKQKLLCFFMLGILLIGSAYAQDRRVSGRVTSAEDGAPIVGVSVLAVGSSVATQTDALGTFTLNVPSSVKALEFRFLGYTSQTATLGADNTLEIVLKPDAASLEEVVVTGFGIQRDRRQLGYGTTSIEAENLTTARVTNVSNALSGKVPGVQVTGTGGAFTGSGIIIRGYTTFTGSNQPLYVIDGVPIDNSGGGSPLQSGPSVSNRVVDLNPEDIESMTVLKGAAATALYGSRAASGVIQITTKKGARGTRGTVTFNSNIAFGHVNRLPEYQNEYAQGTYNTAEGRPVFQPGDINIGANGMNTGSTASWGPRIEGQLVTNFFGDEEPLRAYPNNVKDLFKTATNLQNNLSFSGGGDRTDYRVAYGNTRETYVLDNNELKRNNLTVNVNSQVTDKLRIGTSFTYTNNVSQRTQQGNQLSNPLFRAYFTPRSYDLTNLPFENELGEQLFYGGEDNPYWSIKHVKFNDEINRVFGNINAKYDFTDWLNANLTIGSDFFSREAKGFDEIGIRGGGNTGSSQSAGGGIVENKNMVRNFNSYFTVTANRSFGDFNLALTVGNEIMQNFSRFGNLQGRTLVVRGFQNISNTLVYLPSHGSTRERLVGVFADAVFDYKSYLSLNIKARNDWSSTLSPGNQSIFYPAAALSFLVTEAIPSLKDNNVVDLIKIRANIGEVGKGAGAYNTHSYYARSNPGDGFGASISYPFNGLNGYNLGNTAGNANIEPEFTRETEFGLEFNLFNNRVFFDGSIYQRKTRNVILNVPASATSGVTGTIMNAGRLSTNGIEFMVGGTPVRTASVKWDVSVNFTRFRSVVDELAPGVDVITLGGFVDPNVRLVKGDQYGQLYGQDYNRDEQGRLLLQENGLPTPNPSVVKIGNPNPDYLMGINSGLTVKGFSLSMLFDIRKGGVQYSRNIADVQRNGVAIETAEFPRFAADGVTRTTPYLFEGVYAPGTPNAGQPNTTYVSAEQYYGNSGKHTAGVGFLYDTSWFRLREASLSYALPARLFQNSMLNQLEVGVFGRNLFLHAPNYPHFDPEQNALGVSNAQGLEFNALPATRTFGFNLRLTL